MNKLNFKMRTTKYYYSRPAYVKYLKTLVDGQGNVLYISDKEVATKGKRVPRICVASVYDRDMNTTFLEHLFVHRKINLKNQLVENSHIGELLRCQ